MSRADRRRQEKAKARESERAARIEAIRLARARRAAARSSFVSHASGEKRPSFFDGLLRAIWRAQTQPLLWLMRGAARLIGVDPDKDSGVGRGKIRP